MIFFGVLSIVGWLGAFSFLMLFLLHPTTKKTRATRVGRLFWLFILADSAVMLLLYTSGIINLFFMDWVGRSIFRVLLGILAVSVIWWRLVLFWGMNMKRPSSMKEADSEDHRSA